LHTVVIASQKGGSGKTTLSGHLAVEAERAGFGPVALIDTDPQGSLSQWWNARAAEAPGFVKVGSLELEDALMELEESGVKLAVVDTPPAITGAISKVVACADLVLVPTRPSPHDLRAVGATVDIAERFHKPLVFVVNDATPRARITGEAAVALSQHGTVAPVIIHHRVDFAASMVDGRTVGEVVADSRSAEEVRDLWLYVADRLRRLPNELMRGAGKAEPVRPQLVLDEGDDLAIAEEPPRPAPPMTPQDIEAAVRALRAEAPEDDELFPERGREYRGPERRSGTERRAAKSALGTFGGLEQRTLHPFGRRRNDRMP